MMRLVIFAFIFAFIAGLAWSQPRTSAPVPRMPDGKASFTGVWQPNSTVSGTWEEANRGTGLGGTAQDPSAPVAPSSTDRQTGEGAPYQEWAAAKVLEAYRRRGIDDPTAQCLPPGIPRAYSVGLFPVEIAHLPDRLVILYEYMNVFRVIPLNVPHPDDLEPSYMGDSVGHWEDDTLVVDVTSFNDKTWLIGAGTFHSEKLHITERYRRVSKDRIDYEAVMEDPEVFTKPWIYRVSLMLREGTRVREYPCSENNLDPDRYEKLLKDGVDFQRR
ncbi:MAG: hypothetical protein ABI995_00425 [Acidobacteriota bacterium]